MTTNHLSTYLSDHLAGSTVALELIDHIEQRYTEHPAADLMRRIGAEVKADRQQLEGLLQRVGSHGAGLRQAASWISERAMRLKLLVDDPSDGTLGLLETLEVISLGIEGKKTLWQALQAAAEKRSELRGLDYQTLMARADAQRALVERARIDAVIAAFGP